MLKSYLFAIIAISGLMVGWAFIQQIWARLFNPGAPGTDALENRTSCGSCGCVSPCSWSDTSRDEKGRISLEDDRTH